MQVLKFEDFEDFEIQNNQEKSDDDMEELKIFF